MSEPQKTPLDRILFWGMIVGHAALMVGIALYLQSLDFMRGKEARLLKHAAAVFRTLIPETTKPSFDEYAFINVSYDKQLIDRLDADGFPAGNEAITDRGKLAQLFHILNEDPSYKYLICDIFFEGTSPQDSALQAEMAQLPRSIFTYHTADTGGFRKPIFNDINLGLADYAAIGGNFLKFRLVRDGTPTLPLQMYEEIEGGTFESSGPFWYLNDKLAFNDFVLDYRIRNADLHRDTLNYPYSNLFDLMMLANYGAADQVREYTRDRVVVIGDFEVADQHPTMYGDMAGPLILTNVYIALKNGDNRLTWGFPLFLFVVFCYLSYIALTSKDFFETMITRRIAKNNLFLQILAQGITYMVFLALTSVISFLLFNHYINFLLLTLYLNIVEVFRKWVTGKLDKKKNPSFQVVKVDGADSTDAAKD